MPEPPNLRSFWQPQQGVLRRGLSVLTLAVGVVSALIISAHIHVSRSPPAHEAHM